MKRGKVWRGFVLVLCHGFVMVAFAAPQTSSHSVTLAWDPAMLPAFEAVVSWNIYRSTVSGGPYTLLASVPVATVTYVDSLVLAGNEYFYVETSVDAAGLESPYSDPTVVIIPAAGVPLSIAATSLPPATVGLSYSAALSAVGGNAPYTWLGSGVPGLAVSPAGLVAGTPNESGALVLSVNVTDSMGATASTSIPVIVTAPPPTPLPTPTPSGSGGNWYVRPGGAGAMTGTDWNNAFDISSITWSSVQPGDTIWLAGGTYDNSPIVPGASGTAGNLISIERVLATDAVPAGAAGWNASFDSQVIVTNTTANNTASNCSGGDVLCFNSSSKGNFTYWDGRVDSGISLRTSDISGLSPTNNTTPGQSALDLGTFPGNGGTGSNHDITFTNIDFAGPAGAATFTHSSYDAAVMVRKATGNILITNCRIHGANNNVWLDLSTGVVFDHTKFYDNVGSGSSAGHPNMVQYAGNSNITFRYNDWSNWNTEGLMSWQPGGSLYVYGNVFHDAYNAAFPSVIQAQAPTGPLFFYNNTIANVNGYCVFRPNSPNDWTSGSQARNNIYWNSAVCAQDAPVDSDYDAVYNDTTASIGTGDTQTVAQIEANSSTLPVAPFVDAAAGNFQLLADTPAGVNLGSPYNTDPFGYLRTNWTRGAYEYTAGTTTPAPSPFPTPTPPSSNKFTIGQQVQASTVVNVRQIAAGTLLGTQNAGAIGTVTAGPVAAVFNGASVTWWAITFSSGVSGWVGEDNLVP